MGMDAACHVKGWYDEPFSIVSLSYFTCLCVVKPRVRQVAFYSELSNHSVIRKQYYTLNVIIQYDMILLVLGRLQILDPIYDVRFLVV